jgi:prepilin-type N-terminal cleavage/methylation domain-containing protein
MRRASGFTLVEVVVAVFILAFGLLAVAGLMTQMSVSTNTSRSSGMEVLLASEKLEDLNARGLSDPYITPGGNLGADGTTQSVTYSGVTYVVPYSDSIQVSSGADSSASGDIVETTAWTDSGGNPQYTQTTHSPKGQATVVTTAGTAPTPTADMLVFHRRWLIEKDAPVVGVYRITVWVQLQPAFGSAGLPFQTSMVRPYK